mgnify:FL=1
MSRLRSLTSLLVGMQLLFGWASERVAAQEVWQQNLLERYCVGCHNEQLETGGLALDRHDVTQVAAEPAVWE